MPRMTTFPVIDVSRPEVAAPAIDEACRDTGFFYVVGHGVDEGLQRRLQSSAREFFALDPEEKAAIGMARGGRAWRGWFPVGGELTSGTPDDKEGIYFGTDLPADDARVVAGLPLQGANLFPTRPPALRAAVAEYMEALTGVGHQVVRGVARALGLEEGWFAENMTGDPTVLFRIFHYPAADAGANRWGVGEHTDYGLLTLLLQDSTGGLEVRTPGGWVAAPPIPGSFVCNLGDMLERITGGRYRSTPHRVRNTSGTGRLSFPFFFDPAWDAEVRPVPSAAAATAASSEAGPRWDDADPHAFVGTYGEYLLSKVAKVFPAEAARVLNG